MSGFDDRSIERLGQVERDADDPGRALAGQMFVIVDELVAHAIHNTVTGQSGGLHELGLTRTAAAFDAALAPGRDWPAR